MSKRKPLIGKIVGVIVIGVLLAALIAESVCYVELSKECAQSKETIQEYLSNYRKLKSTYKKLKGKYADLKTENKKLKSQIKQLKETQQAVPEEGMLSPSSEVSVFSQENMVPGNTVKVEEPVDWNSYFHADMIERDGEVFARINGKSWRDNDNISLEELRYLKFLHYNFDHEVQVGEMIVNEAIAEDVKNIFRELFDIGYEIESIRLVDEYWVDGQDGNSADYNSIEYNNTSCFNYRVTSGRSNLSQHAYGRAIDINPQQNPYISNGFCYHENAQQYVNRTSGNPHVIVEGDDCYNIFEKYGFAWGGNWSEPIDYQHFEKRAG